MSANPATPNESAELRKQLLALLNGGQAHVTFDDAVKDFAADLRGKVPEGLPYSAWQLIEHMRITQRDILNFSAPPTGGYHPITWPDEYWPNSPGPTSASAWDHSIAAIRTDREHFEALLTKPDADLAKPFRWGDGQNLLREALLIADHTAYHLGELIVLRRLLGNWEEIGAYRLVNESDLIRSMLGLRTIAVVGLSDRPDRASHYVSAYMKEHGYTIYPINPALTKVLGEKSYASLADLPIKPDIVNVFRLPNFVPAIVDEMLTLGLKNLWVQQGIINLEAAQHAEREGIKVVMDRCLMVEHRHAHHS